ncbi:hypothetical protein BH10BAC5_BH10BAC5_12600 [soil metagenome]
MNTSLKSNEHIVLITRRHWKLLIPSAALFAFILGISIAIISSGYNFGYYLPIFPLIYFLYKLMDRQTDLWAVTNLRVIDEKGVFTKNSKESPIDKINNVSYEQSFWGRLFHYGDVEIQTAAEIGETVYHDVQNPKLLQDTITTIQEDYKKDQMRMQAEELANAINRGNSTSNINREKSGAIHSVSDEIEKLHELMRKGILTQEEFNQQKSKLLNG